MAEQSKFKRRIKQHVVAREHVFYGAVQPGFEETAAAELRSLGIADAKTSGRGGVEFRGKMPECYRVNLRSRSLSRVLMRLFSFKAGNFDLFRDKVREFPWELYIAEGSNLSFGVSSSGSRLYHTGRIEEECRHSIGERLEEYGVASGGGPDQQIFVRIEKNRTHLSLDASGELLYRRHYKTHVTEAPLRENMAAMILMEAGIGTCLMLVDPMCGSGTFTLEGCGLMLGMVPGADRDFAFMNWPCYSAPAFEHEKKLAAAGVFRHTDGPLAFTSDNDPAAIKAAGANIAAAGLAGYVALERRDFLREGVDVPAGKRSIIALNPPLGKRLTGAGERFYRSLGDVLRNRCGRCGYAVITPSLEHEKILSLPYDKKILFNLGGLDVAVIIRLARD